MQYSGLIQAARKVRENAYAPYSNFPVGAALQTKSGRVFVGCNTENISFGLTLCGERSAIASAVAAGDRDFVAIAIVADSHEPPMPCGGCRQVLAELNRNLTIVSATVSGQVQELELANLLPRPDQGVLEDRRHV